MARLELLTVTAEQSVQNRLPDADLSRPLNKAAAQAKTGFRVLCSLEMMDSKSFWRQIGASGEG